MHTLAAIGDVTLLHQRQLVARLGGPRRHLIPKQ